MDVLLKFTEYTAVPNMRVMMMNMVVTRGPTSIYKEITIGNHFRMLLFSWYFKMFMTA